MDISFLNASGIVAIDVPIEVAYDFIADMPAMGAISPQCTGGEWQDEERGVGAHFVGSNAMGDRSWQALMRVIVADRPREFAWENIGAVGWSTPLVRWGYTFETFGQGTKVEETWRILEPYDALEALGEEARRGMPGWFHTTIAETLSNLKAHLEQTSGSAQMYHSPRVAPTAPRSS